MSRHILIEAVKGHQPLKLLHRVDMVVCFLWFVLLSVEISPSGACAPANGEVATGLASRGGGGTGGAGVCSCVQKVEEYAAGCSACGVLCKRVIGTASAPF